MTEPGQDVGLETLRSFEQAEAFNRWLFESARPPADGHLLEIGSGIGNISRYLLGTGAQVSLSDLNPQYCDVLEKKFAGNPRLDGIFQVDLAAPDFGTRYQNLLNRFDAVVALNVVEHIADDVQALRNCRMLLKDGGSLVILVPAYGFLFNGMDRELGHYRRYTKKKLAKVLGQAGFNEAELNYFNFAGIPGWLFTGFLLRKKIIPDWQLRLFNRLVPFFRLIDKVLARKAGLSVIGKGKK